MIVGDLLYSCFDAAVAMLVVANLIPILPVVQDVVSPLSRRRRRPTLLKALLTGNCVALAFALGGGALLRATGTRIDDLRVAGGIILLVFAIYDLLFSRERRKEPLGELAEEDSDEGEVGMVPLGVPLMVGPATLATALVLVETHGLLQTVFALVANMLGNGVLLVLAERLISMVGLGFIRAVGKVFGLLLAAMAVSMIRSGVANMLTGA